MRAERIVRRSQWKKTMKARLVNLRNAAMVAFQAGRESVLKEQAIAYKPIDPRQEDTCPTPEVG